LGINRRAGRNQQSHDQKRKYNGQGIDHPENLSTGRDLFIGNSLFKVKVFTGIVAVWLVTLMVLAAQTLEGKDSPPNNLLKDMPLTDGLLVSGTPNRIICEYL